MHSGVQISTFRFLSVVKIAKKTELFGSAQTQPLCIADVVQGVFISIQF